MIIKPFLIIKMIIRKDKEKIDTEEIFVL